MSWEGHSQNFCENGHYFGGSAGFDSEPTHCPFCKAKVAVCHLVDDTNIDAVGTITDEGLATFLLEPEETATCNLGHVHVTKHAVYRIPTREELQKLEHYWDQEEGKFIPCSKDRRWGW